MELSFYLQIVILIVVGVSNTLLAIVVLKNNSKSVTNRMYAILSIITVVWLVLTFFSSQPTFINYYLQLGRVTIFLATVQATCFFLLAKNLPEEKLQMKKHFFYVILLLMGLVMLITLSPFVFAGVEIIGNKANLKIGPAMPIFIIFVSYCSIGAVGILIKRVRKNSGVKKKQFQFMLFGITLMLALIIFTIMLPVILFQNDTFLAYSPLYALIFLGMTAYAIIKHHLFNIKVIATEALVIIIWIILFSKIFSGQTSTAVLIDTLIFVATVPFGILLIRSVIKEVKHREELEILSGKLKKTADDLGVSNLKLGEANEKLRELDQAKSEFMSIASHQLRTPLAGIVGYLSMLTDGDYGKMEPNQQQVVIELYQASQRLVRLVNTFLNVTRIEAGRFTMNFAEVNIVDVVTSEVKELQPTADKKGTKLIYTAPTEPIMVTVDSDKIRDVFLNLIDNAIKYTPEGSVSVFVEQQGDQVHFHTKDTGVGIEIGESEHLFEKFVRGTGIARVAPNGSGLGLYIVKKITEAHQGKVWVESAGPGKGSSFHVLLPLQQVVMSEK